MHTLNRNTYILAICLAALGGCVDAIGFLQLGGYFIAFMSGNSTRLAVNLIEGNAAGLWLVGSILLLFVLGVMLGSLVRHFSRSTFIPINVLGLVTLLLVSAATSVEIGWSFVAMVCIILAMGAENAIFQKNGEVVVGLTYMTGTLVKIGQRLAGAVLGGAKFSWAPYLLLWMGLIAGGMVGTLLFYVLGMRSLWFAAFWAAILTLSAAFSRQQEIFRS